MRILIDILHPAHVHFFRNFYFEMTKRGHEVLIMSRKRSCIIELLDSYEIPHTCVSHRKGGGLRLIPELFVRIAGTWRLSRKFRPDVLASISGPVQALASKLVRKPAITFYDTEFATQTNGWVYPLSAAVCTPDCYRDKVNGNHFPYAGFHELAYLHESRFKPDPAKLKLFGVEPDEPFTLFRFVAWDAFHDVGQKGLPAKLRDELIETGRKHGKVLVSCEGKAPAELEPYLIKGPAHEIHHLMAFARGYIGESPTMCTECAVQGTPGVIISPFNFGYGLELQNYGLVKMFNYAQLDEVGAYVRDWLAKDTRAEAAPKLKKLREDKIDVTAWMIDFFEKERWKN